MEPEDLSFTIPYDKYTKALPDPFKFPDNYSPLVASSLSSGHMAPNAIEKFITEVGRAAFSYKYYPLTEELERLAQQCVSQYPFLKSSQGSHVCCQKILCLLLLLLLLLLL